MNYLKKLKSKWGIKSNLQLLVIFFVFGLTGSVSMKLTSPTLSFFNIKEDFFTNYNYFSYLSNSPFILWVNFFSV